MKISETPTEFHDDLTKAVQFLESKGCHEIYLFGSLADKTSTAESDIDIAVRGIKPQDFFSVYGELLMLSEHSIDLVDLDLQSSFGQVLINNGSLKRVS